MRWLLVLLLLWGGLARAAEFNPPGTRSRQPGLSQQPDREEPGRDAAAGAPAGRGPRRRRAAPGRLGRRRRRARGPARRRLAHLRPLAPARPRPAPPYPARSGARRPGRLGGLHRGRRRRPRSPIAPDAGGCIPGHEPAGMDDLGARGGPGAHARRPEREDDAGRRPPRGRHPGARRPHRAGLRPAARLHLLHHRARKAQRPRPGRLGPSAAGPARRRDHPPGRRVLHRRPAARRDHERHHPRRPARRGRAVAAARDHAGGGDAEPPATHHLRLPPVSAAAQPGAAPLAGDGQPLDRQAEAAAADGAQPGAVHARHELRRPGAL